MGRTRAVCPQEIESRIDRRHFLKLTGLSLLGTVLAGPAVQEALAAGPSRLLQTPSRLRLFNIHTGESLDQVYRTTGGYQASVLSSIDHLLRDHRTGDVHPIDPRLLDFLDAIARQLEVDPAYQVISGFRSPRTNAVLRSQGHQVARKSYHVQGQAVDVRMPGVGISRVHQAALGLQLGGVGLYRGQDFIHVDTGPFRSW